MELTTLHWDETFSRSYYSQKTIIDSVKFRATHKMSTKGLLVTIEDRGKILTTNMIDRSIGKISIFGSPIDKYGDRVYFEKPLAEDIDCEVCSYLYEGQIWYHIMHVNEIFGKGRFKRIPISGREIKIIDE